MNGTVEIISPVVITVNRCDRKVNKRMRLIV